MKKAFFILLFVFLLVFFSSILIKPAIIFLAKRQLSAVFKDSEVSIGGCRLNLAKQLSFSDIKIKNQAYEFLVKKAGVQYSLPSIFRSEILKFALKEVEICINLPQKNIVEFSRYLNLGPKSAFLVKSLELSDLNFDLKAEDLNAKGILSLRVNPVEQIMDYLDIKIDSLEFHALSLNDLSLRAAQNTSGGHLGISRLKYNKLNISGIKSEAGLMGKELMIESMSAKAFGGEISGNLKLGISQNPGYGAVLKFTDLDIARFIDDFELKEKFEMTGRLGGDLTLKGRGTDIEILSGELSSFEPGGILMIKDTNFLENMARNTNQSLNLLVENFKNYHYNVGNIKLSLHNDDLTLDTILEGETGKRNLSIILHNFTLKKER